MINEFKERTEVANQMYAIIYPCLVQYERRGFNAHQRAQTIISEAMNKCEDWVRIQVRAEDEEQASAPNQF